MPFNEADTRAKLIDPAIHKRGWTEDLIRREETAGTVEIINGKARRRSRGKIDYVLRVKVNVDTSAGCLGAHRGKEGQPAGWSRVGPSQGLLRVQASQCPLRFLV